MAKYWVDPPNGHLWGFPKVYDGEQDAVEWLVANGYPAKEAEWAHKYVRMWEWKEGDSE